MFMRPEIDKINPFSMIICGLTIAFFRFFLYIFTLWLGSLMLRLVCCCTDFPEKPLSKCRRFLHKWINYFTAKVMLLCSGYHYIKTVKKRIKDYDQDYQAPAE